MEQKVKFYFFKIVWQILMERCVIVVPDGVLFNSTKMYKETRKYLMDKFE